MPRKSLKTADKVSVEPVKNEINFEDNIKKWINITEQIISLESQLSTLRIEQMNLSKLCVNQTDILNSNTSIVSISKQTSKQKSKTKSVTTTEEKKPVRRKRRTKAEIELEKKRN